jgi:hypothetical protein
MHFDWSTLALQTVNFSILVWLLYRFLYRPVLRLLDARRAEIDKQYAEAHMAEAKAKDELAAVEADRGGIAAERAAALEQASAQAAEASRRGVLRRNARQQNFLTPRARRLPLNAAWRWPRRDGLLSISEQTSPDGCSPRCR